MKNTFFLRNYNRYYFELKKRISFSLGHTMFTKDSHSCVLTALAKNTATVKIDQTGQLHKLTRVVTGQTNLIFLMHAIVDLLVLL